MTKLVALTGATGFIGSALLNELRSSDFHVRALGRKQIPQKDTAVEWIKGDLNNVAALNSLVKDADYVIHCAGVVRGKSPEDFDSVNYQGTSKLFTAIQQNSGKCHFLLISTLAAREPQLSWYAQSKFNAERLLDSCPDTITPTIFRPTAVYGCGDTEITPLFKLMKKGLLFAPSTESRITLLHVTDMVSAILKWLQVSHEVRGVFELADGNTNGYTWSEIKLTSESVWNRSLTLIPVPLKFLSLCAQINLLLAGLFRYAPMLTPVKLNEITHPDWTCNIEPLYKAIGWKPAINLADALNDKDLLQI